MPSREKHFIRLSFGHCETKEVVEAVLLLYEPLGFLEEDDRLHCFFDGQRWAESVEAELMPHLREQFGGVQFEVHRFGERNWNKEWEDSIVPIRASRRFVITQSWHPLEADEDDVVIAIDPKMSFGTGYHATTRLMLRLLENCTCINRSVLDVGAGTGVLAIAAALLGAEKVTGVDIDDWSIENALENVRKNDVSRIVEIRRASMENVSGLYDIIMANITLNDNINMLDHYRSRLDKKGSLLLSGFFTSDVPALLAAAAQSEFVRAEEIDEDGWAAVLFMRK